MSQWRRNALEQVPTCKSLIEEAENPMALWIELLIRLEFAYEAQPPEEETIRQIYAYALWCWHKSKNGDLTTAVACAFFEHLPLHEKVREDVSNRISRADFWTLEDVFRYHLPEDKEFGKFKSEFFGRKSKPRKK